MQFASLEPTTNGIGTTIFNKTVESEDIEVRKKPENEGEDINKFKIVGENKMTKFRTDKKRKVKPSWFLLSCVNPTQKKQWGVGAADNKRNKGANG